ncbi:DUF5060 domain-containing protein [Luteolibacter flavescens]|uniref:DUF5060 domain-containing protein n=1 Tax=Luteolibacter flavescens TaxID=1859460 RepID=A0ABT3FVB2_9BACT|nr:DUF5060 domain-containing protein [Luteolibacter flavescens]MCW1887521.1 DUF5060 domain-containing protein [Luteolibacter flavescens]
MSAQTPIALPVEGELKRWHKLTFDFAGPQTGEAATPNPFTDYRADITFIHTATGTTRIVPGYYAADGNAAETSATTGNIWRVHFAPDLVGEWTYTVSFRSGTNVASADDAMSGSSGGHFDGVQGAFVIAPSDKTGRDFRSKGRLEYVGRHYLRFSGSGEYFMKTGVDSPENLLSYADFDGDFKTDGQKDDLVKTWGPHVADWQAGDPVWQGTKGKGLIGALNYLAAEGLNSVSFLTMNINGDDRNVFPYTTYTERSRFDVSRLDQWETIFEHGTRKGLYLHFKTQETENETLLDSGNLGPLRKLYYRELIARYSHHLALNWNLGEEINDATTAQKQAWAKFFHDNDPYRNHIVIHNGDQHFDLMGPQFALTGMSLQLNESNFSDTFTNVLRYVRRSSQYGKPWVVGCDEPGNASASLRPDNNAGNSHTDARRDALWATILAGGAGCEFYFGYNYAHSDTTCQDFRSRDAFWAYCRNALQLFAENDFSFELMSNQNELVSGNGDNGNRCLAKTGDTYLVQLRSGGSHTLNLSAASGAFSVQWFDPRNGGPVIPAADVQGGGTVNLGSPPSDTTQDWIVLVKSTTGGSVTNAPPMVEAGENQEAFLTGETVAITLEGQISDDGLPDPLDLEVSWMMASGPAPVVFSQAGAAATQVTFSEPGTYVLSLAADDGDLDAHDEITVTIELPSLTGRRTFSPVHDAFTDDGENDNGSTLAVRAEDRLAYLTFDLTTLDAVPLGAKLRLTEAAGIATGETTIRAYAALSNDWDEAAITSETAPAKGAELGSFTGSIPSGGVIEIDLGDWVTTPGVQGLFLEAESGEAAFASKEATDPAKRPLLVITTEGNTPPVYAGHTFTTTINKPVTLPYATLLGGAYDPDGDPVTPVILPHGSTAQGGQVSMNATALTYTPSIDYFGPDSFPLTVEDGRGGFITAQISVEVTQGGSGTPSAPPILEHAGDGAMRFRYTGTPGVGHTLQRSTDLLTWITLASELGVEDGVIDYLDTDAPETAAFYRIVTP